MRRKKCRVLAFNLSWHICSRVILCSFPRLCFFVDLLNARSLCHLRVCLSLILPPSLSLIRQVSCGVCQTGASLSRHVFYASKERTPQPFTLATAFIEPRNPLRLKSPLAPTASQFRLRHKLIHPFVRTMYAVCSPIACFSLLHLRLSWCNSSQEGSSTTASNTQLAFTC